MLKFLANSKKKWKKHKKRHKVKRGASFTSSADKLPLINDPCTTFLPSILNHLSISPPSGSSTPLWSVFLSPGMLWQDVAVCYTGLYSPSAYYPVRLNTQVGTKGQAWKLQLTSLSTQHNSLTRMKTRVCELSHMHADAQAVCVWSMRTDTQCCSSITVRWTQIQWYVWKYKQDTDLTEGFLFDSKCCANL